MRRGRLTKLIVHLLKLDGLICFSAYILQKIDERFVWVFVASSVMLLWLCVAGLGVFFDFLTGEED